jgi:hypothetical protein
MVPVVGKRLVFDQQTWQAVELLAKDSLKDFQELASEAFADLLKKAPPSHWPQSITPAKPQSGSRQRQPSHRRPTRPPKLGGRYGTAR